MVVLVIIGILTLVALPRFMNMTTKAKTTEAKTQLRTLHALMQAYYFEYDVYTTDLAVVGFEQAPPTDTGGNARALISVESADGAQFIALATSVVDFDKDGTFNVWEVNQNGFIAERTLD